MAQFSKRHYVTIAQLIADLKRSASTGNADVFSEATINGFAVIVADRFALDNRAFDRARFLVACGVDLAQLPAKRTRIRRPRSTDNAD